MATTFKRAACEYPYGKKLIELETRTSEGVHGPLSPPTPLLTFPTPDGPHTTRGFGLLMPASAPFAATPFAAAVDAGAEGPAAAQETVPLPFCLRGRGWRRRLTGASKRSEPARRGGTTDNAVPLRRRFWLNAMQSSLIAPM